MGKSKDQKIRIKNRKDGLWYRNPSQHCKNMENFLSKPTFQFFFLIFWSLDFPIVRVGGFWIFWLGFGTPFLVGF
jgi:hypothetical protein